MSDISNGSFFCKKRKLSDSPETNKRKQPFDIPSDPCLWFVHVQFRRLFLLILKYSFLVCSVEKE